MLAVAAIAIAADAGEEHRDQRDANELEMPSDHLGDAEHRRAPERRSRAACVRPENAIESAAISDPTPVAAIRKPYPVASEWRTAG